MRAQKYYLSVSSGECTLLIKALLAFRTKVIAEGGYADCVNDVIMKIAEMKW